VRRWILKKCLRHRVIVTLKSGAAFGGVLYEADTEAIVLKDATVLEANGSDRNPVPADGSIVVLRAEIDFMQFP
jgi:small nuclear ribonucleoprotein (snRNP)-like protein